MTKREWIAAIIVRSAVRVQLGFCYGCALFLSCIFQLLLNLLLRQSAIRVF